MRWVQSKATLTHRTTIAMGGIKHTDYSIEVKEELEKFFKRNGIDKSKKMTGAQMEQFVKQVEKGLDGVEDLIQLLARSTRRLKPPSNLGRPCRRRWMRCWPPAGST